MESQQSQPRARTDRVFAEQVEDEAVVYDLDTNVAHALKPLAAAVFTYADGEHTVAEIAELTSSRLGEKVSSEQVEEALAQLENVSLIERPSLDVLTHDPISRRTALKAFLAAGAGTFLVTSVAAPAALACDCSPASSGIMCATNSTTGGPNNAVGITVTTTSVTGSGRNQQKTTITNFCPVATGPESYANTCTYSTKTNSGEWQNASGIYQCLPCDGSDSYTCCQVVCGPGSLGGSRWGHHSDCYSDGPCWESLNYKYKYCSTASCADKY